ncbi:putative 1-phosphatidylinositol-3-phosphate 5-kinase FAB1D isoform X2 [Wolffia australiana]
MDLHQDQELENLEHGCDEGIQSLLIEQLKENGDYVVESSSLSDDECDSEKATRSDGSSIYSTPTLSPSSSFASFKSCLSTLEDDEAGEESGKIMDGDEPRVVSPHERDVKVLRESWSENGDNNSPKNFGDELEDTISPALSFLQSQMQSIDKDPGFYLSREYNWSMVTPDGLNEENNREKGDNQLPFNTITTDPLIWLPPHQEQDLTVDSEQAMPWIEKNRAANQLPVDTIMNDPLVLLPPVKEHDLAAESEQTIPLTEEDKATYQLPIDTIAADSLVLLPPGKEHDFTAESEQTMPLTEEDKATNQLPIEIIAADSFVLLPPDKEHDLTAESEQAMLLTEENKATNQLPIEIIAADSFVLLPPDKEHDFTAESEQTIPLTEEDKATYQLPIDTIAADSLVLLPPGKEHDFTAESEQTMPLTEEDKATNQLPIEIIAADSFVLLPPDKEHDLTAESEQAMLLTEENKATNQLPIEIIAADSFVLLPPDKEHDFTAESEQTIPLTEEDKATYQLPIDTIAADSLVLLPPGKEHDFTAESEQTMPLTEEDKATNQLPIEIIAADSFVLLPPDKEHDLTAESEQAMLLTEENKATNQLPIDTIAADPLTCLSPDQGHDLTVESERAMPLTEEDKAINKLLFQTITADPLVWLPPYQEQDLTAESENPMTMIEDNKERVCLKQEPDKALMDAMKCRFKFLVSQFLAAEEVPTVEESGDSWLEVVSALSWEASQLIRPNLNDGNAMDPGLYIKVKCVACGSPSHSQLIKGLVFKKNTAHRHMQSSFTNPRLLLFKGALGHEAVCLSSFDSMEKEKKYSKFMIEMIDACRPDIILVEKSVSRDILESLLERRISVVIDMKLHRLKRISICTGSPIISSADILTSPELKQCDLFYIEKFFEDHAGQSGGGKRQNKTLMFFDGCPRPLGCTILLKGSHSVKLKRVKRAVQSAVSAAYHLSCETAFLADQKELFSDSHQVCYSSSHASTIDIKPDASFEVDIPSRCSRETSVSNRETRKLPNYPSPRHSEISDNKGILVLLSRQHSLKGRTCEQSHLSRIEFYRKADVPLGRFIQELLCPQQGKLCSSCGEPPQEHSYSFTHYNGNLTIMVRKIPIEQHLPGEAEGEIWMWVRSKSGCPKSSGRIVMSDTARGLSFGRFLELCFLSQSTYGKILPLGSLLYKEWVLFFGLGSYVAIFVHSPIDVYTVCQPPPILDFNDRTEQDFLEEEARDILQDGEQLFADMARVIASIRLENKDLEALWREENLAQEILASRNLHPEIRVADGKGSNSRGFSVICLFPEEFHRLRSFNCSSEAAYVASIGRCKAWDAQGGKSGAIFAKSLDGWLVIKQISRTELESFVKFAPDYFKYVSSSFCSGSQTCLARILGIYQVKQTKNGRETKIYLVVMENLLHGRLMSRVYDLKGAVFSRHVAEGDNPGKVLLDQNFVQDMVAQPIYFTIPSKRLLQRAIWNDTSFLTAVGVMDYSLLIGVDEGKREVMFGIIDYLRQYTWDKKLENWAKASWVVPKNEQPTVISPREYQKRFRKFMSRYFLTIPHAITSAVEGMLDGS